MSSQVAEVFPGIKLGNPRRVGSPHTSIVPFGVSRGHAHSVRAGATEGGGDGQAFSTPTRGARPPFPRQPRSPRLLGAGGLVHPGAGSHGLLFKLPAAQNPGRSSGIPAVPLCHGRRTANAMLTGPWYFFFLRTRQVGGRGETSRAFRLPPVF